MRFVQFSYRNYLPRLGVQLRRDSDIVELCSEDTNLPNTMLQLLREKNIIDRIENIIDKSSKRIPLSEVRLLPPITKPDKVICVGLNYKSHCEENNLPLPKEPFFFSKFSSCIIGPNDDIQYPIVSKMVDWEVELAVVIGKGGYNIPLSQSQDHIFGYTVAQDISARDWQKTLNGGQFLLGKSMDSFCPIGPAIVTKESINDVYSLNLKTTVNDEVKQNFTIGDMIHKIDYLISRFSRCITLLPGDIILTGTPAGVGMARSPPEFLKPGDVITSEIDEIGCMRNKVVSREM